MVKAIELNIKYRLPENQNQNLQRKTLMTKTILDNNH